MATPPGNFELEFMRTAYHPRLSWRWKALIPLLVSAVVGMLLMMYSVRSLLWERRLVLQHHILVGSVILGLVLVMLVVLMILVHRPLSELRQTIARASQGDWPAQVSFAERADEIGALGSDFNEMVHHLKENCERCNLLHRAEMREAEHLATLGEVAAGLAHEIKNPLAGISGAVEVVASQFPPHSPTREILGEVQGECDRIQKLVNDLSSYAKPKKPAMVLADLNATVEAASQFSRQLLGDKNLRLETDLDPKMPEVLHNPQLIQQVFLNLLLNSVQALQQGGTIRVRSRFVPQNGTAEVTVTDSGPGIPPNLLPRIFQPFFTTKGTNGTGLGLSLSKRIMEQHGGGIRVHSILGKMTEFTIRLPVATPQRVTQPSAQAVTRQCTHIS